MKFNINKEKVLSKKYKLFPKIHTKKSVKNQQEPKWLFSENLYE